MSGMKADNKRINDMTKEELEKYHHTPETELSLMVCRAKERNEYAHLKDFLQVMHNLLFTPHYMWMCYCFGVVRLSGAHLK